MLYDDAIAHDLARVLAHVDLMERMLDVGPGGCEVSEVHHRYEVEVPLEMAGVVAPSQPKQLRYTAERIERLRYCCFASTETWSAQRMQIT